MYYLCVSFKESRVVIILPSIGIGGAEQFVNRLMDQLGDEISFLLVILKDERKEITIAKRRGIRILRLKLSKSINPVYFIQQMWFARREIFRFQPTAIQCFLYPSELFSLVLGKRFSVYWSIRGTGNPLERSVLKHFLIRLNLFFANYFPKKIVACSDAAKNWALSKGVDPNKILIIHNFLDKWTETTQSKSKLLKNSVENKQKHIRVGMAARLDPHKGHFQLIDAVANCVDRLGLPMTLTFIGTGTEKICLPKTITSRKSFIDRDYEIEFLGPMTDVNQKALWFSNLDIYVMASQNLEGFPNSLYEAVAIGCPYVSTSSGNVNEFLEFKYLSHSYTSDSIADRIVFLINTPTIILNQDIQKSQVRLKIAANPQMVSNAYIDLWLN